MVMVEENGSYQIDCTKAVWASDKQHDIYHTELNALLKDADWIIETKNEILIVEYKNGKDCPPKNPFNPADDKYIRFVAEKYYDTVHYLNVMGKNKIKKYIYVLEYPKSDPVTRKLIRDKIIKYLPFVLQNKTDAKRKIIDFFDVVSIDEWNKRYPDFLITRL